MEQTNMNNETALTLSPTIIETAIGNDPALQSPHSRRQYNANLRDFEAWRMGQPLTKMLVEAYAAHLQNEGLAPSTINQKLATIRWWARKMVDFAYEHMDSERARRVSDQAARVLTVKDVKGDRPQAGRHVTQSELLSLLRACVRDESPAGARDAALFAVAWTTGMRNAELRRLKLEDMTITGEDEADLTVHGKGNKPRTAYLFNGAFQALNEWLDVRGREEGYIFCPVNKSGKANPKKGISGETLRRHIFDKRIDQAGIKHTTAHDFRRAFAGNLLDHNDLATVQALLGHASPTTTATYDRRPERTRKAAVKKLFIPAIGE
jgi:site-specific recombinase XerD